MSIDTIEDFGEYHPTGLTKMEGKQKNGKRHGRWFAYYENGFKWSEGKCNNGKREGIATIYYDNGKKKMEGFYKNGLKVGIWKVWEKDGSIADSIDLNRSLTSQDSLKVEVHK
jgi:antitoxin component YwqK of YwqJK toxin-antitoxin module